MGRVGIVFTVVDATGTAGAMTVEKTVFREIRRPNLMASIQKVEFADA